MASIASEDAHSTPFKIVPQPVRKLVEEQLRASILNGVYSPGERLPDRLLCEQMGVSRGIVREAIRLLEGEGLVTVTPYRGPHVTAVSADEAGQIFEMREALESAAGQAFALRASNEEVKELREAFESLSLVKPIEGKTVLFDLKRQYYDVLLRGCRNPHLSRALGHLLARSLLLRVTSHSTPDRFKDTINELRQIVEAMEARDPEAARQACVNHIRAAAKNSVRVLREREAAAGKRPKE